MIKKLLNEYLNLTPNEIFDLLNSSSSSSFLKEEKKEEEEKEILIINYEDLIDIQYITSGSSGDIYSAYIGENKYILKKYLREDDFIREITYMKLINSKYPNTTCNIFGYIYYNENYYLIMEEMICTLEKIFIIIKNLDFNQKEILLKRWYSTIVLLLNNINKLGIIHNDLKSANFVLSENGDIKIIDFGLSDFLGFGQTKILYSNYSTSIYIKAPDNYEYKTVSYNKNEGGYSIYEINRKNYSSDMYSIGSIMLEGLFMENEMNIKYNIIDNKIYYSYDNFMWNLLKIDYNKNSIFLKEIKKIMMQNSLHRPSSFSSFSFLKEEKEEKEEKKEKEEEERGDISNIYFIKSGINIENFIKNKIYSQLKNYYFYSNTEIINKYNELIFLDDIILEYKDINININNNKKEIFHKIINSNLFDNISLDILFNVLINNKVNINNYINYIEIYKCIFDYNKIDKIDGIDILVDFIPIMIFINKNIILLQKSSIGTSIIINIEIAVIDLFISLLINNNINKTYKLHYIIDIIFNKICNKYNIDIFSKLMNEINEEILLIINDINS